MRARKNNDPFWWTLFGAGGTISAFFLPIHILLIGIAIPFGLFEAPDYESLLAMIRHPLARLYLFVVISFSLFHWAHRFRYTLYDGLQLKHLEQLIVVFCYGGAFLGTLVAAIYLLII